MVTRFQYSSAAMTIFHVPNFSFHLMHPLAKEQLLAFSSVFDSTEIIEILDFS
jgi:hypothetical protein